MTTTLPASLYLLLIYAYVLVAPYTKVEESFNVQATFDALSHPEGLWNRTVVREEYDHVRFPGVVPRTFVGAALVSLASAPLIALKDQVVPQAEDALADLMVVRLVLGTLVWLGFRRLHSAIVKTLGIHSANWFLVLTACQFHLTFYASRPLPNTFALGLSYWAYGEALESRRWAAVAIMIVNAALFRCDILLMLAPLAVWTWLSEGDDRGFRVEGGKEIIVQLIRSGLALASWGFSWLCFALVISIPLDTHLWIETCAVRLPPPLPSLEVCWPEARVLYFNTVLNKSSHWGTAPWYWYLTNALPRALLGSLPLGVGGFRRLIRRPDLVEVEVDNEREDSVTINQESKRRTRLTLIRLFTCAIVYVGLYSLLPHKELRFLFPALPIFNLLAAHNASQAAGRRRLGLIIIVIASFALSSLFLGVSSMNYPGGDAMRFVAREMPVPPGGEGVLVHIDAYTATNGASKYGEARLGAGIRYSKDESPDQDWCRYTHLLTGDDVEEVLARSVPLGCEFEVTMDFPGEPRLSLRRMRSILFERREVSRLFRHSPLSLLIERKPDTVKLMRRRPTRIRDERDVDEDEG